MLINVNIVLLLNTEIDNIINRQKVTTKVTVKVTINYKNCKTPFYLLHYSTAQSTFPPPSIFNFAT